MLANSRTMSYEACACSSCARAHRPQLRRLARRREARNWQEEADEELNGQEPADTTRLDKWFGSEGEADRDDLRLGPNWAAVADLRPGHYVDRRPEVPDYPAGGYETAEPVDSVLWAECVESTERALRDAGL